MSDLQNYYNIPVRIDDIERDEDLFKSQDPFNKSWDEVTGLGGLNAKKGENREKLKERSNETTLSN